MTEGVIRVEVPAGFWPRLLAFCLDAIAAGLLESQLADALPPGLVTVAYFWLLTGILGRTPGKIVLGIELVGPEGKVGLGRAFLREVIGKLIGAVAFGLGLLWIAFDPQKRGWHDVIADTRAVRVSTTLWAAAWESEIAGLLADRGEARAEWLVRVLPESREAALRGFAVKHARGVTLSEGVLTPTGEVEWF